MNWFQTVFQLAFGDFKERVRRYSFLMTMLWTLFWGYLVITRKYSVQFGNYQSEFDSIWAGNLMAILSTIMLTFVGFYLVKNSIKRDRVTKVGQIIAGTQIKNFTYIFSKFISNFTVLFAIVLVLMVLALVMQLLGDIRTDINLWELLSPFLIINVPVIIFISSLAILFESIRWLRGSLGNVLYLFMMEAWIVSGAWVFNSFDLTMIGHFRRSVQAAVLEAFPGVKVGMMMGFIGFVENELVEATNFFQWNGLEWTNQMVLHRFKWVGLSFMAVLLAVPFFERFDPAKEKGRKIKSAKSKNISVIFENSAQKSSMLDFNIKLITEPVFNLIDLVKAELKVMLKGFHLFWYLVALLLIAGQIAAPFDIARQYIVPVAMVWPLVIWSGMGTRESRFGTRQLLFSSPYPLKRQLPALWLAGLSVGFMAVSGMIFRAIIMGEVSYLLALIIGVLFVPSLALALGSLSSTKKLFEVIYLIIWYAGSIDHIAAIDFLATTEIAISQGISFIFFGLTLGLIIISILTRYRQTAYH